MFNPDPTSSRLNGYLLAPECLSLGNRHWVTQSQRSKSLHNEKLAVAPPVYNLQVERGSWVDPKERTP